MSVHVMMPEVPYMVFGVPPLCMHVIFNFEATTAPIGRHKIIRSFSTGVPYTVGRRGIP